MKRENGSIGDSILENENEIPEVDNFVDSLVDEDKIGLTSNENPFSQTYTVASVD